MQKVRSCLFARTAYKITISNFSLTVLFSKAYVLYLAFEEGSPLIQTVSKPFYLLI